MASSKRSCQHTENKTAADEVENWGRGGDLIKMLGRLIKMEFPTLFSLLW